VVREVVRKKPALVVGVQNEQISNCFSSTVLFTAWPSTSFASFFAMNPSNTLT